MYPLDLLENYLKTLDEVMICELLDISTEDLLKAFKGRIRERRQLLEQEVEMIPTNDGELNEEEFSGEEERDWIISDEGYN